MKDSFNMRGEYIIEARDTKTGALVWSKKIKNMLTAVSQTARMSALMGDPTYTMEDLQFKYFAFGTGTTQPTVNDTQLADEQSRYPVTKQNLISPGIVETICSIPPSESNFDIKEIGVFCGPNATSAANTGLLLSRVLANIPKNTNTVVNIIRRDITTI